MPMISSNHAICPKCGDPNQVYYFYVTWNSAFGDHVPKLENFCTKCGTKISDKNAGGSIYRMAARNIDFPFKE